MPEGLTVGNSKVMCPVQK